MAKIKSLADLFKQFFAEEFNSREPKEADIIARLTRIEANQAAILSIVTATKSELDEFIGAVEPEPATSISISLGQPEMKS